MGSEIDSSSPGQFTVRTDREERAIGRAYLDRAMMLSTTLLGFSAVFFVSDKELVSVVFVQAAAGFLGASLVVGSITMLIEYSAIRDASRSGQRQGAGSRFFVTWLTLTTLMGFAAGVFCMAAFTINNASRLTG